MPRSGPAAALIVAVPLVAVAVVSALLAAPPEAAPPHGDADEAAPAEPDGGDAFTFVALGDSITRATSVGGFGEHPQHSWATGDSSAVRSVADRLREARPERGVDALNVAESGARAEDVVAQARLAAQADPDLVTLLVGANDACAPALDEARFRASVRAALSEFEEDARVVVFAVPDVARLRESWGHDPGAVGSWAAFGTCPAVLGPDAVADAGARVAALNVILEEEAARAGATFSNATADAEWDRESVSTWDFFHPSLEGQRRLAAAAWPAVKDALALES